MAWRTLFSAALLLAAAGTLASACGTSARKANRGESCAARHDCKGGLACVANVCQESKFELKPTGNECVPIDCRTDDECCQTSDFCDDLASECDMGITTSCDQFDQLCRCDARCEDNQCVERCDSDTDCFTNGGCVGGRCVECQEDDDCFEGFCVDNACEPDCDDDLDCPVFHECQGRVCVEVGCKTDRECIAAEGNVLAFCEDTECKVPCDSDLECGSPDAFAFRACVDKMCVDVGCEDDAECRVRLGRDAECRPETN